MTTATRRRRAPIGVEPEHEPTPEELAAANRAKREREDRERARGEQIAAHLDARLKAAGVHISQHR